MTAWAQFCASKSSGDNSSRERLLFVSDIDDITRTPDNEAGAQVSLRCAGARLGQRNNRLYHNSNNLCVRRRTYERSTLRYKLKDGIRSKSNDFDIWRAANLLTRQHG